jgi:hypothetical protein
MAHIDGSGSNGQLSVAKRLATLVTAKPGRLAVCILSAFVFLGTFLIFARVARHDRGTFVDEPGWVLGSVAVGHRVTTEDFAPGNWDDIGLGSIGDINPPIGKAMIGVPLVLTYRGNLPQIPEHKAHQPVWGQDLRLGDRLSRSLLIYTRLVCCGIFAAVAVTAFLLAMRVTGLLAALLTVTLLLCTPLFTYWSAHVVTDGPYLLWLLCTAHCCIQSLRSPTERSRLKWLIAASLCAALASNVKVTAVIPAGILIVPLAARIALGSNAPTIWRRAFRYVAACVSVGLLALVGTNPSYWIDFGKIHLPAARAQVALLPHVRRQAAFSSVPADRTAMALRQTCPDLYNMMRPAGFALMFVRWSEFTREQAKEIVNSGAQASRTRTLTLALVGLVLVLGLHWMSPKSPEDTNNTMVLTLYMVGQCLSILLLPVVFTRYYLPCVVGAEIVAACVVARAVNLLSVRLLTGDRLHRDGFRSGGDSRHHGEMTFAGGTTDE